MKKAIAKQVFLVKVYICYLYDLLITISFHIFVFCGYESLIHVGWTFLVSLSEILIYQ